MATSSPAKALVAANAINPGLVLSHNFPEVAFSYDERDVALYALGVGACAADAVDERELQLVYHRDEISSIKVLPTFFSLFTLRNGTGYALDVPGLQYDPNLILHSQQYIEVYRVIPSRANVIKKTRVAGLHDRGKTAVLELESLICLEGSGEHLCMSRSTFYLRGSGGFSDSSQPFSYATYPANRAHASFPDTTPTAVYEDHTQKSQALLFGSSTVFYPLHSDPCVAQASGFSRPILHGLCTLGYAIRAVLKSFCNGEPAAVKSISCRFLLHVYPGETLVTETWLQGNRVLYRTKVKERNQSVLSGYTLLSRISSSL
ncbi:enoyl-CoA hydratase 2, peroxisomal-like [Oryza brachyantha]|uniref:enoyl-CoA hydratase 2, peroxisomal-like n=1 Tax=Oryza brachyantha TaxID=4533 RepID=UPI0003EADF40|nr:enoyl-CoA hydratase 2, peroxisomal-like [Oryza brachyantha]